MRAVAYPLAAGGIAPCPAARARTHLCTICTLLVAITWDSTRINLTRDDVATALRQGEPRIEARPGAGDASRLDIGVWMMEPEDAPVVAARCAEIFRDAIA